MNTFCMNHRPESPAMPAQPQKQTEFVDHFYVVEDLQAAPLQTTKYDLLPDALSAYFALPKDKVKALGAHTLSGGHKKNMPGMLDLLQCKNRFDTIIEDWKDPSMPWWKNPEIQKAVHEIKRVRDSYLYPHELGLTKDELRKRLLSGETLDTILELQDGQECQIFKADRFYFGNTVVYIPDLFLNDIPYGRTCTAEEVDHVLSQCYTGDDILESCGGNMITAVRVFYGIDWQHPGSAADEEWIYDEEFEPRWLTGADEA